MSALARLVARASRQAQSGLTPRLPARFETSLIAEAAVFETVSTEVRAAAPPPAHAPEPAIAPSRPPAPAALSPAAPPAAARAAGRTAPNEEARERRERQPATTAAPAPPAPLLRAIVMPTRPLLRATMPRASPPGAEATRPAPTAEPTAVTMSQLPSALGPLPEPLLPPAPPRAAPAPDEAPAPARSAIPTLPRRTVAPPAPEPPEITVHIGRLHVVAAPRDTREPRAAAERPRPRADMLSDYLRGKDGGR